MTSFVQLEPVNTMRVLQLAGVTLPAAAPVPLGPLQVRADHIEVGPARQGPLFDLYVPVHRNPVNCIVLAEARVPIPRRR